jgi:microcystin-dependent protein
MAYQINFSDPLNNEPLIVEDGAENNSTSLVFVGRNKTGYAQAISENFLHLLENFASGTAPINPTQGQLWYDTSIGVNQLKIWDGTGWSAAGGLKKGSNEPEVSSSVVGDLWVNTDTQQLYLFTGSGWILVGPRFSSGAKTGAEPETIVDTLNNNQSVVSQYVDGERVMIISKTDFIPKSVIPGFTEIKAGTNLNNLYSTYYGTADKTAKLVVSGFPNGLDANNFVRKDIEQNTQGALNVRNSSGVSVGTDAQFTMNLDGATGVIRHKTSGAAIDIRVNNNNSVSTVIRVDANERVGIRKLNPQEALDVTGNILSSGTIKTTDTTESTTNGTGSAVFAGGVGIAKNLNVGGNLRISGDAIIATNLLPDTQNGADIGNNVDYFREIHAGTLYAKDAFRGDLIGNITGNAQGSSSKLASSTVFEMTGDVTSSEIEFDGQIGTPTVVTLTASGNGTTATLTFAVQTIPPYPVGSTITVSNIVPIGYRGTYIVTGATANSVSYANTTTGAQTTAGQVAPLAPVGNRKTFFTRLSETFVADKPEVITLSENDQFLISRSPEGLKRITKTNLFNAISGIPVGSMMPFAGPAAPPGWLLCDGSEVSVADYETLFSVIGYIYGDAATLLGLGTFKLPDMRGRFALGLDNMTSGITVPQGPGSGPGWDPANQITTGGGPANRVTDVQADIDYTDPFAPRLGAGAEDRTLDTENLPDHEHDLRGNADNPYYAYRNNSGDPADTDAISGTGNPPEDAGLGQYLGTSGGILTDPPGTFSQTALNVMNPYLALNYIIYTGA